MKRFIVGLMATLFLTSVAMALTVESDYVLTNKGSKTGAFTKTQTPLIKKVYINGWETKQTTAETVLQSTASARITFVAGSTTAESYIYIIGKTTAGAPCWRTLRMDAYTNDEVVAK